MSKGGLRTIRFRQITVWTVIFCLLTGMALIRATAIALLGALQPALPLWKMWVPFGLAAILFVVARMCRMSAYDTLRKDADSEAECRE
jgi:hypothetical protein